MSNNVLNFPSQEQRVDEASLWIARIDRGLTEKEKESLVKWLRVDPENSKILLELASLWDKMDRLSFLSELFQVQPNRRNVWVKYAIASCFCLFFFGILIQYGFAPFSNDDDGGGAKIYQTAIGEQRTIFLEDGSTLFLNTDTDITVNFSSEQRLLNLSRGEIHIDVAHDSSRPLRVAAHDKIVQAVGTAFDVRIVDANNVSLWVTEGRVLIMEGKNLIGPDLSEKVRLPGKSISISQGEKIILSDTVSPVEKMSEGDIAIQKSWRQGNIVFRGETLDEAILEFNRYSDKTFVIQDEALKRIRIAGVFKIGGATTDILSTLKNNFSIEYKYTADNKILLMASAD